MELGLKIGGVLISVTTLGQHDDPEVRCMKSWLDMSSCETTLRGSKKGFADDVRETHGTTF